MTPGEGSKYREFYDLSGICITCMDLPNTIDLVSQNHHVGMLSLNSESSLRERLCTHKVFTKDKCF